MQGLIINPARYKPRLLHIILLLTLISLVFSIFSSPLKATNAANSSLPTVAITQIIQHGSLDEEYKGIIEALKDAGYIDGKTIKLIYQNAQGNLATANLIASNFASKKPTVAVGISTPSAQSLVNAMKEQNVPLIFTAVTDPLAVNLVTTFQKRPEAIAGVTDALMPGPQLELITKLKPSVKTIGIVYNPGETNSVKSVNQLQDEAKKKGLTLVLATADKTSDVIPATHKLITKVDAIYIPNDNTAVASIDSIVGIGKKYKIPVFAGDAGSVERGAVAAQAYDRVALGREAGELIVRILQGEKAGDLVIALEHPLVLMINLKSAQEMGVDIPDELKKNAKIIGDRQ